MDEDATDAESAMFDKLEDGLTSFTANKLRLGQNQQCCISDKCKGKKLVHRGRPCISTSNSNNPLLEAHADVDLSPKGHRVMCVIALSVFNRTIFL